MKTRFFYVLAICVAILSLEVYGQQDICILPKKSVEERLADRIRPSVVAAFVLGAWGTTIVTPALNLPPTDVYEEGLTRLSLYDLYFVGMNYTKGPDETWQLVPNQKYPQVFRDVQAYNNNMLFLAGVTMREAHYKDYPEDFEYWLRDENGNRIEAWAKDVYFLDFTHPGMQQVIIDQAVAVANCRLFDGIFFDWWHENGVILADSTTTWGTGEGDGYRGFTAEQTARDNILKGIREQVTDEFLILVNTNRNKIHRTAWGINGTFMETGRDYKAALGYTREGILQIEDTLRWSEQNMREPRINCLEGWGLATQAPDSPLNKKWMRLFTTMSLTHSDGFVLFTDGIQHQHYWHDFWDVKLDKPTSEKSIPYENIEGLFIREFTNGYAVYNRSGSNQIILLPMSKGVESKVEGQYHILADLDGEIYLKSDAKPKPDINNDGVVNILDLVIISARLGKSQPDLNADGIVNILDLVIVANNFSK